MKNLSFSLFNLVSVFLIAIIIILIVLPFNLINLDQAERIAKWKSEYEKLNYCFSLVNLHEGSIVPSQEDIGKILSDELILERIKPYFNIEDTSLVNMRKYKYKKLNGRFVPKTSQFYFDKFIIAKDGSILSIKKRENEEKGENFPEFFMFIDINGEQEPNRIGQDIFFINIYKDHISALGSNRPYAKIKANCSAIGSGLYCSEYYLLGGRF